MNFAFIGRPAMVFFPKYKGVYEPTGPITALQMPTPRVRGKCLVGPRFLTEQGRNKHIAELVDGYPKLVKIMP